jgi:O-antigen ligase/polysaccharide polymerase Wzy-like membrane protein
VAMIGTFPSRASTWPTSDRYASSARTRTVLVGALGIALALVSAAVIVASDGPNLLVVLLPVVLVALAVLARPIVGVYLVFAAAILFEQYEITGLTPITTQFHIFQNISGYTDLPIRVSAADLLMLLTLGSFAARHIGRRREAVRIGAFGKPIAAFLAAFGLGLVIGIARGSGWDPNAVFQELRGGPGQMCLMYFLTVNLVRDRRQVAVLTWELVILIGVKSLQAILNYQQAQSLGLQLEAVTGHEDIIFFDLVIALLALIALSRARTKLRYALLVVVPLAIGAELVTERRVAFIALGAVLLVVGLLYLADGSVRRAVMVGTITAVVAAAYLAAFWDDSGPLGQPARAISGLIDPSSLSERDQNSNHWRDIENRNIAFTIQQLPLTGVGVGQEYLFREEPPSLGDAKYFFWRNITHNTLLWFWLKAGPLGGFVLWFLVARILLLGSTWYARLRGSDLRWVVALPVMATVVWVTFAAVEPAMTFSRGLIVLGALLGLGSTVAGFELSRSKEAL